MNATFELSVFGAVNTAESRVEFMPLFSSLQVENIALNRFTEHGS